MCRFSAGLRLSVSPAAVTAKEGTRTKKTKLFFRKGSAAFACMYIPSDLLRCEPKSQTKQVKRREGI